MSKLFHNENDYRSEPSIVTITENKVQGYDFNRLQQKYPDIVAWLDVPNTHTNLPVVQHPDNDYFYLTHNPQKILSKEGSAYIELANNKNMTDSVTIIYGHNMLDDRVFSNAHYFSNAQFFNENDKFIYIPGQKLTYTIVSVYVYDDRHILNSNSNFVDKEV